MTGPFRVAVLVKQVPALGELCLGADGRLQRDGLELELNPYCRRAVAKGVELARAAGGSCVAVTLGPPCAADVLREAVAWGADEALLLTDPAFAGSDTLATARALAAALRLHGPFDLVLTGRNSVDADTGQVGPQLAELLDLAFLGPVRELTVDGSVLRARCERDDGFVDATVTMPAVLSAAERLCAPAKVPPAERAQVAAARIQTVSAAQLGPGPWGQAGSPTSVGGTRILDVARRLERADGSLEEQVRHAARAIADSGVLLPAITPDADPVPQPSGAGPVVIVLGEPGRERATRELVGGAARLGGRVMLIASAPVDAAEVWSWGADEIVELTAVAGGGPAVAVPEEAVPLEDVAAEDVAAAAASACALEAPWAVLAPSTPWGREAAARLAASLGAGLTGDAVELEVRDGRLVCWKPAFGGQLVAAVTASSPVQLATVRPGALPLLAPRHGGGAAWINRVEVVPRGRVQVVDSVRDDDPDALALARVVVGVGQGIEPSAYPDLKPLLELLDAKLGATRKVTDQGWLPRSRQIGITGQNIAPDLYIALAVHGKPTHVMGVRRAGFVLAINADPQAPIFDGADFGIVGAWQEALPLLVRELADQLSR